MYPLDFEFFDEHWEKAYNVRPVVENMTLPMWDTAGQVAYEEWGNQTCSPTEDAICYGMRRQDNSLKHGVVRRVFGNDTIEEASWYGQTSELCEAPCLHGLRRFIDEVASDGPDHNVIKFNSTQTFIELWYFGELVFQTQFEGIAQFVETSRFLNNDLLDGDFMFMDDVYPYMFKKEKNWEYQLIDLFKTTPVNFDRNATYMWDRLSKSLLTVDFEHYWGKTSTEVPWLEWDPSALCEYAEWSSDSSIRPNRYYGLRYIENKTFCGPVREIQTMDNQFDAVMYEQTYLFGQPWGLSRKIYRERDAENQVNQTKVRFELYDNETSSGGSVEYDYFFEVTHLFDPQEKLTQLTPDQVKMRDTDFVDTMLQVPPTGAADKAIEAWKKQNRIQYGQLLTYWRQTSKVSESLVDPDSQFDMWSWAGIHIKYAGLKKPNSTDFDGIVRVTVEDDFIAEGYQEGEGTSIYGLQRIIYADGRTRIMLVDSAVEDSTLAEFQFDFDFNEVSRNDPNDHFSNMDPTNWRMGNFPDE